MQLDIFNQAQQLRDIGIKQSLEHAETVHNDWKAKAYNFLLQYIKTNKEFMTEDVRRASQNIVPQPPSERAWGGIIVIAARANLIKRKGYKPTTNPKAHNTPATEWQVVV